MLSDRDIFFKLGARQVNDDMVYSGIIDCQKYHKSLIEGKDYACPSCSGSSGIVFQESNGSTWILCSDGSCQSFQMKGKKGKPQKTIYLRDYVPESYWDANLVNVNQKSAELISSLRFLGEKKRGFIVMMGPNGVGKTWCAVAAGSHYIDHDGIDFRFWNCSDLYMKFLNEFEEFGNPGRLRNSLVEKEFLIIDDLGIKSPSESFKEFIYIVIDARMNSNLPTIITTNLQLKEINDVFGKALSSRFSASKIFLFAGQDRREGIGNVIRV